LPSALPASGPGRRFAKTTPEAYPIAIRPHNATARTLASTLQKVLPWMFDPTKGERFKGID